MPSSPGAAGQISVPTYYFYQLSISIHKLLVGVLVRLCAAL